MVKTEKEIEERSNERTNAAANVVPKIFFT